MGTQQSYRKERAKKNIIMSVFAQVVITVMSFANRSVFIYLLGEGYLGVDGLFTSILTMMSLAELGVGNAIIFSLYKPVAEENHEKIRELIGFYSTAYKLITTIVAVVGIALLPFLKDIVNLQSVTVDVNITVVYLLFLLNTCSSYFWAYKQSIIIVHQKQSTISGIQMTMKLIVVFLEILSLYLTKNYYLYLIIRVVFNYVQAYIIGIIAEKQYPEAKVNKQCKLPKNERKTILKNVRALMWYKVSNVFITSTDNIMINAFVGTETVGYFSNYTLITSAVQSLTSQIFSSLTATIGNFNVTETKKAQENLFDTCVFATFIVYGFCSLCLFTLSNRFITLMWGDKYVFELSIVAVIVLNFYLYGFQSSILIFRNTNGLFVQGKYRPLVSALINVVVSLVLAKYIGVVGVVLGTAISRLTTTTWFDPYILYKHQFETSVKKYYMKFIYYVLLTILDAGIVIFISSNIKMNFMGLIVVGVIDVIVFMITTIIFFHKSKEFAQIFKFAQNMLGRKR